MRTFAAVVGSLALALAGAALGSCGGSSVGPSCKDGIDNDGDGLFDFQDPGCSFNDGQSETPDPTACNDEIDNDGDGLIDGEDWGCQISGSTSEVEPNVECNDGLDNDGDLLADYPQDPGCESPIDADESNPPQCSDGEDNDGDGKSDWPHEPGCESPEDTDEADPSPPPTCGDDSDNDGDGAADYPEDPGCQSASDISELDDCMSGVPVNGHLGGTRAGTTNGGAVRLSAPDGCELTGSSAIAPEEVYGFILDRADLATLTFDTQGSTLDTVLYVRQGDCQAAGALALCNDDTVGTTSMVQVADPAPAIYYVIVDGKSNFGGNYSLNISGTIAAGGACDDEDEQDEIFTCDAGHSCDDGTCVAD